MENIRTFIAVDLPPQLLQRIQLLLQELKPLAKPGTVRWVPPQNMHLTLKFLGDATPEQLDQVKKAVQEQCRYFPPFEVSARGLGGFPSIAHARVLWMGLTNPPGLKELQRAIDNTTAELGFPGENRPFSPHLTLGRVADSATSRDLERVVSYFFNQQSTDFGTFIVNAVHVDRSDLQPGGARYTRLSTSDLRLTH